MVVKYASDLPMIPIVLTSVGAKPDMGIQVWMLGEGRAIPRNYYHTVINDAVIDWITAGANYNDVIIRATKEAVGRHTFVTEYAGSSDILKNVLNAPGRFGSNADLAAQPDAITFVEYLNQHGYATFSQNQGGGPPGFGSAVYSSQLLSILANYIPVPASFAARGITAGQFYQNISYYLGSYRTQQPGDFVGYTINYQPAMMATEIDQRVVQPTLSAGMLFDKFSYLTRLYTTLSPEDMNKDPVFSFNAGLTDYSNTHNANLTYHCGFFGRDNPAHHAGDAADRRRLGAAVSVRHRLDLHPAGAARVAADRDPERGRRAAGGHRQHQDDRRRPGQPGRRLRGRPGQPRGRDGERRGPARARRWDAVLAPPADGVGKRP